MTTFAFPQVSFRNAGLAVVAALPLLLLGVAGDALAQGSPVSDAPPRLEKLDEIEQPRLTKPKPQAPKGTSDRRKGTTDSRDNSGAVTETRVQTGVGTYYVRPNRQVGTAQPGDLQGSSNRAAQFKVGEFDLGRKKGAKQADTPQTLEPAPAPPAMPEKN